jgi:KDO2-lipid IV(A) lauroyltransferase
MSDDQPAAEIAPVAPRQAWWVRALAALPLGWLYGLASLLYLVAARIKPYRPAVIRENLQIAFPDLDAPALRELTDRYYAGYADVMVEIFKAVSIAPAELAARVTIRNLDEARSRLALGRPVLLVAAHQCNWEWMLLALSLQLGYPLDAAYKPLVDPWAERGMKLLRTRFGARVVPAQDLLMDIIRRRQVVRAIAMVADQEPVASEQKHWTRFLNRDSAFFLGAEEIVRKTRYPALFIEMRRVTRGHYEMNFVPMTEPGEVLQPGEFTERYARRVEAQIRSAPADWPWSHKRWRLRKPLYSS